MTREQAYNLVDALRANTGCLDWHAVPYAENWTVQCSDPQSDHTVYLNEHVAAFYSSREVTGEFPDNQIVLRKPETIGQYLRRHGFEESYLYAIHPEYDQRRAFDGFKDWPIESHCGQRCAELVVLSLSLLEKADPAAHAAIWRALIVAMSVICHG